MSMGARSVTSAVPGAEMAFEFERRRAVPSSSVGYSWDEPAARSSLKSVVLAG